MFDLDRFKRAQERTAGGIATALGELQAGRKQSHWIWYIFPQLEGLGSSPMAQRYAIRSLDEARAYLDHPVLGPNVDVVGNNDGAETTVLEYSGCAPGVDVTLWTMQGVSHIPYPWLPSALDHMVDWVIDHPRESP